MRLYLSSYRFGNHPKRYAKLFDGGDRVGIITNAQDVYPDPILRREKVEETLTELQSVGLNGEELDLRNYFGKQNELASKLQQYDGFWARGGNSFVLRKAMRYSGFDNLIKELMAKNAVVYGGYSAGACVIAKDMHGLDLCDEPTATPSGYNNEIIWEGLSLLPYAIVPHFKSDHPESNLVDKTVAFMDKHNLPYKTLHDGEVIVIDGDSEELLR